MASSTIEALETELAAVQTGREAAERAVVRAENAHDAACSERDDAWSGGGSVGGEVEEVSRLTTFVYDRRRELYGAIDHLKACEGRERRIKSRLMYVLPAERRRYLSGVVDGEFVALLREMERVYRVQLSTLSISIVTARAGVLDLAGDATWRALERLYGGSSRRWVAVYGVVSEASDGEVLEVLGRVASHISYYAGGHTPRIYHGEEELAFESIKSSEGLLPLESYDTDEGWRSLARVTAHRYLDEGSVARLAKRGDVLVSVAGIARLYQTMNLTVDEIRWRLEQLIALRFEMLGVVSALTGERKRFSFYEIARAARLLDAHFPDPEIAAEALERAVEHSTESSVPLVDVVYMDINGSTT